ncbi:hypothetical protein LZZ90_04610 [Flavobacterium sp. SM15]|uniref:hypothetical protein n=1 Tax=Flavobacterium sp. SM15 TaxID=2908005 RepID=UPI001EDB1435|nr:hypothetical protein [Flavobacterium sp. SM15]MCG2610780.1 hypothetical protein [Flavobacterium sp. SM15]
MERKLISRNETAIKKSVNRLNEFTNELTSLIEAYNDLNIGQYSNEVFKSQLTAKGENEAMIYLGLEKERLKKAGITNDISIEGILKNHKPTLQEYKDRIKEVLEKSKDPVVLDLSLLEYNNDKFVLPKKSIESITEMHCIYANGKEEIEIIEYAEKLINDFNLLKLKIEKYAGRELNGYFKVQDFVFSSLIGQSSSDNSMLIRTDSVDNLKKLKRG